MHCLSALPEIDGLLQRARRILIATDFDGTLCPIVEMPSEARLAPVTLEVLRHVRSSRRIVLAAISGRALADVRRRLPLDIIFAGNHGLEIDGGGMAFEHSEARQLRPSMARACEALTGILHQWPSAWVEDKGMSATLHFRKVEQRQHSSLLFAARRAVGAIGRDLALHVGRLALEIRPKVQWDKGRALLYIQEKAGPFDACICLGDDRTDEAMFRANAGQVNIRVGRGQDTAANYYLPDPAGVAIFLSHVVDVCGSEARGPDIRSHEATTGAAAYSGV